MVCFARRESEVECKTVRDDLDFKQTLRCVFTVLESWDFFGVFMSHFSLFAFAA